MIIFEPLNITKSLGSNLIFANKQKNGLLINKFNPYYDFKK